MTSIDPAPRKSTGRVVAGFMLALVLALSAYVLIDASRANQAAFASIWFLAILPAFLSALICYIGDPGNEKPASFYWTVPLVLVAVVIIGSVTVLREGVICLIMLAPIWLMSGWIGAFVFRAQRARTPNQTVLRCSLLFLPLLSGAVESQIPYSQDRVTLERRIVIHASPEEIWPFTLANAHIADTEGRWTFAQNIVGLPRPRATRLVGAGPGAVRTAYWGDSIDFDEIITEWEPGRRLGWRFSFTNSSLQNYTDQHIAPDGQFLKIESGDYTLEPLGPETTRLTLRTVYLAKTHANTYAEAWGEILLGDVQDNILAILQQRAESAHRAAGSLTGAPG